MGVDLESIMSKSVSGGFQLRRPTVCISSMLNGKPGPCFLLISLYLSIWSRSQFEYIFTSAESSVVLCGRYWVPVISAPFESCLSLCLQND